MKVGDYLRTHDGRIDKIVDIKNDFIYIENSDYGYREKYLKSSPDIIDLIEVGDYVNGSYIYSVVEENKNTGQPRVLFTEEYGVLGNGDIKSIVTKEQFSCMEYKIGE